MSIIGWLVVGFLAGGFGRIVTGAEKVGCLATIVTGIIGALLGGVLFRWARGDDFDAFNDFSWASLGVAFVGATALLLLLQMFGVRERRR